MATSWWRETITIAGEETTPEEWLHKAWLLFSDVEITEVLAARTGRNVTQYAVTQKRQSCGLYKTPAGIPKIFEESKYTRYDSPPVLETDDVLVMGDIEAPFHDAAWCSEVVALAARWGIKNVILAGDFIHFDSISTFAKKMASEDDEPEPDITDEILATVKVIDTLLDTFDNVLAILGNHEARLTRRLAVRTRTTLLRHILGYRIEEGAGNKAERLEIVPYYHAIVHSSDDQKWLVTHPKNESVIPVRVASRMADIERINTIAAHGHDWGHTTSASGYYAAACGCCADHERLSYVALRKSLRPRMQRGAWILRNGRPYLLHPVWQPPRMFGD